MPDPRRILSPLAACLMAAATLLLCACDPANHRTPTLNRSALIPEDAGAWLHLSDSRGVLKQLRKSSVGRLWTDPEFQDFLGHPDAEDWKEFLLSDRSDLENEVFIQQLKMLRGEVILAMDGEHKRPAIIAAMSKTDFQHSLELDQKLHDASPYLVEVVRRHFKNVEIIQYIDHPGTKQEMSSWQAHVNETLVLGNRLEWLESCITQLKQFNVSEPEGAPQLNLMLIPRALRGRSAENMPPRTIHPLWKASGIDDADKLTLRIEMQDEAMLVDTHLEAESLKRGFFALLDPRPVALPAVAFIPENLAAFEVGRADFQRFRQELPQLLARTTPLSVWQFNRMFDRIRARTGRDLDKDLIQQLGSEYFSYAVSGGHRVLGLKLNDAKAVAGTLEALLITEDHSGLFQKKEFEGHPFYALQLGQPHQSRAIAVTGNHLLFGPSIDVQQAIRSSTNAPPAEAAYIQTDLIVQLRNTVPEAAFAFGMIDWKENIITLLPELSHPAIVEPLQQRWAMSGSALPPPDFKRMPSPEHIASFFNSAFYYTEPYGSGLHQRIILKY